MIKGDLNSPLSVNEKRGKRRRGSNIKKMDLKLESKEETIKVCLVREAVESCVGPPELQEIFLIMTKLKVVSICCFINLNLRLFIIFFHFALFFYHCSFCGIRLLSTIRGSREADCDEDCRHFKR